MENDPVLEPTEVEMVLEVTESYYETCKRVKEDYFTKYTAAKAEFENAAEMFRRAKINARLKSG